MSTSWHAGEVALQERNGVARRMAEVGPRVVRDHMPDQHREFFAELPWLLVGSVDDTAQPHASVLAGPPGFVRSPEPRALRVDALPAAVDPLARALRPGAPIGLLGLQPHTRRRNRMNGWVRAVDAQGFDVEVGQSFGNCPKYIQPREALYAPTPLAGAPRQLDRLDDDALAIVTGADTFFIATAHPQARESADPATGVDMSHRGGPAGFVRVLDDGRLQVPDYVGNSFFNTLGNLQLESRCGLLFIDFATGAQLHIRARARLEEDPAQVAAVPGALRLLMLTPTGATLVPGGLPLHWRAQPVAQL